MPPLFTFSGEPSSFGITCLVHLRGVYVWLLQPRWLIIAMSNPEFSFLIWDSKKWASSISKGFPCGSADEESACSVGDLGSIPGLGRSPGEGKSHWSKPTPVFWPGESHSQWGHKELDKSEWLSLSFLSLSILKNYKRANIHIVLGQKARCRMFWRAPHDLFPSLVNVKYTIHQLFGKRRTKYWYHSVGIQMRVY